MSRVAAIFYCPFCAEEDLLPVPEPTGAWSCEACARVFRVTLESVDTSKVPGRVAEEAQLRGER